MQTIKQIHVSYQQAQALIDKTFLEAEKENLAVAACVVDANGRIKAKMVMDGTSLIADELVEKKAKTALLGLSSEDFGNIIHDQTIVRDSMLQLDGLTLMGGGLPLMQEGQIIGAFAVGGALVDQDIALAKAVLTSFA